MKPNILPTKKSQEKAILIGIDYKLQDSNKIKEYLDELEFLAETAGAITIKKFTQKLDHPNPKTYLGTGRLEEVSNFIKEFEIDMAIFDDELSPSQIRNIEKELNCKIIDRSNLILDIFAKNARTAQAKTQVELAQCQYLLPRLTKMWTHLSKQKGGIGMKGPGETEIETDRRIIRNNISLLKEKLKNIDQQNITRKKGRDTRIRLALVGYTNVGKSTIMNLLSKSELLAENKLFATLDATVRKVVFELEDEPGVHIPFLLSDTVGFIRKLPHQLIECFKSTLDEVRDADILIHVIDVSHPSFEEQMEIVNQTLQEIGAANKLTILVFNKIDQFRTPVHEGDIFEDAPVATLEDLKRTWMAKKDTPVIFLSATEKTNVEELRKLITQEVAKLYFSSKNSRQDYE